jgi:hypothetical protein
MRYAVISGNHSRSLVEDVASAVQFRQGVEDVFQRVANIQSRNQFRQFGSGFTLQDIEQFGFLLTIQSGLLDQGPINTDVT